MLLHSRFDMSLSFPDVAFVVLGEVCLIDHCLQSALLVIDAFSVSGFRIFVAVAVQVFDVCIQLYLPSAYFVGLR